MKYVNYRSDMTAAETEFISFYLFCFCYDTIIPCGFDWDNRIAQMFVLFLVDCR